MVKTAKIIPASSCGNEDNQLNNGADTIHITIVAINAIANRHINVVYVTRLASILLFKAAKTVGIKAPIVAPKIK